MTLTPRPTKSGSCDRWGGTVEMAELTVYVASIATRVTTESDVSLRSIIAFASNSQHVAALDVAASERVVQVA